MIINNVVVIIYQKLGVLAACTDIWRKFVMAKIRQEESIKWPIKGHAMIGIVVNCLINMVHRPYIPIIHNKRVL